MKTASKFGGVDARMVRVEGFPDALARSLPGRCAARRSCNFAIDGFSRLESCLLFHRAWLRRVRKSGTEVIRVSALTSAVGKATLDELSRAGM